MAPKKKRFTLDLDIDMQRRLKMAAASKGISMRQYCVNALENRLSSEETEGEPNGTAIRSRLRMTKLRDEIFGRVHLEGDSTDLIRKSRDERSESL